MFVLCFSCNLFVKVGVLGLKQIIKNQKILQSGAVDAELVLPGEPLIYSIKYTVGSRTRSVQFFRDMKWKSLLKSFFRSYYKTHTPVVVIVRFYVTPPQNANIKLNDLRSDTVPAVYSYELCDYLLSFLEMLHHVLINSYRQVVKIDVQKFYSSNPRTVFQFMKWDQYVYLQNHNTVHTKSKGVVEARKTRNIQPELQGNAENEVVCEETPRKKQPPTSDRASTCDSALSDSCSKSSISKKASAPKPLPAYKKA